MSTIVPALPEHTLGWQALDWCSAFLRQPDGDNAGAPFVFTDEQARFILSWYAIDAGGRWVFRRGQLRRAKGWGKSPIEAALCLLELCGPCRFDGWDANGQPVAVPHPTPWVVLAGVSEEQTLNTMSLIGPMVDGSELADDLDLGITRIYTRSGGRLHPITASAPTQEGARPSAAYADETHHWLKVNGGHKLAEVIRRNLAKSRDGAARMLELTNAHEPGMDSVAERTHIAHEAQSEGRTRGRGILLDTREAPPDTDLADEQSLRAGLAYAYGDSTWVDIDRIVAEVWDPGTPVDQSRRFYLNQIVAAADSWVAPHEWDANANESLVLEDGDRLALGFDGGRSDDSTALVGCRIEDGAAFLLGLWERPEGPAGDHWQVDRGQVRGVVDHVHAVYKVVGFAADEALWQSDIDQWAADHRDGYAVKASTRHPIGIYMADNSELTRAAEALQTAIVHGELPHNGDPRLSRHVYNARRRPNRWGVSFGKEHRESSRKIDALSALLLARMMRQRITLGAVPEKPAARIWGRV